MWMPVFQQPVLPDTLVALDHAVKDFEIKHSYIKPDNEARIVWYNGNIKKTKYSLVYLHGFSASQGEGEPLHRNFANQIGANLYLSRLEAHGTNPGDFKKLSPQTYLDSAIRAVEIGKKIGEKCIVIGTSTGALLALYLAARIKGIHALYLYSPLLDYQQGTALLLKRRLINVAANLFFSRFPLSRKKKESAEIHKYWYPNYPLRGALVLTQMLEVMSKKEIFNEISIPVFMGYYYKSKLLQDPTVSVSAMLEMFNHLGTSLAKKREIAYPEADSHVITSALVSAVYQEVLQDSLKFFEEVIKP